jgi:hypothetical protein
LLLGQAESGKSTLQKQFQLLFPTHSLEQERSSWRTVIYLHIVSSIQKILSALKTLEDTVTDEFGNATDDAGNVILTVSGSTSSPQSSPGSVASLRLRLSYLVSMEFALADRLSGGIKIPSSGTGGVYVRSGWQSRIIESAKTKQQPSTKQNQSAHDSHGVPCDLLVADVARILKSNEDDIRDLWNHSVVKDLIAKRHLNLDEWSEL